MVQVLQGAPRKQSIGQQLIGNLDRSVGVASQMLAQHQAQQKQAQADERLAKEHGINLRGFSPDERKIMLQESLRGKNQEKLQKSKLEGESEIEGRDYGVIKSHFGDKFANIWRAAPVGGRTKLLETAIESSKRGYNLDEILSDENNAQQLAQIGNEGQSLQQEPLQVEPENLSSKKIDKEISEYVKKQDEGLLPSEKVSRGKERFDSGLKQYQEAGTKLRGMAVDKERLDILETLNKTDKLPKDLGRLNVDAEGNLRAPFLSNPETQRYVKTLNEFSSSAKDTFGSRVTNFDLAQYLKRFPTLMNTGEGRRQLLDQMKVVNQINSVYYKNLKNVYDKAGGVRNIDADVAERFAEQLSEGKIQKLTEKFKEIGQFASKPAAAEFKGKKIKDKETGEIFISDGTDWIPAE